MKKNVLIYAGMLLSLLTLATIVSLSFWQIDQIATHERSEDLTFDVIQNLICPPVVNRKE